jgi:hypothetical protein
MDTVIDLPRVSVVDLPVDTDTDFGHDTASKMASVDISEKERDLAYSQVLREWAT